MHQLRLDDIKSLPLTYSAEVMNDWMDQMGHMNVMWYTHLFSEATYNFTKLFGVTAEYMKENKSGIFALEAHIHYYKELNTGDKVHTRSCTIDRSDKRFQVMHFIVNDHDGSIAAIGEFVGGHVDLVKRRLASIPSHVCDLYDAMMAHDKSLGLNLSISKKLEAEIVV